MSFFNSDGKKGSMCGNGGRCSVAFAHNLGLIKDKTVFTAIDGLHEAVLLNKATKQLSAASDKRGEGRAVVGQ